MNNSPVVVLIAASDRAHLHLARTIPSLLRQTGSYDAIVIVDDTPRSHKQQLEFWRTSGLEVVNFLKNKRKKGAAGTWNTGLDWIRENYGESWVAILDDDDEWLPDHLSLCQSSITNEIDAVISGIATFIDDVQVSEPNHGNFNLGDFLHSNPGWQGSNTFIRLSLLERVGRFDENLECTHDRDLAVRLLELDNFRYIRTGQTSVRYHINAKVPAYTRRFNPEKLSGLRTFLQKHGHKMTIEQKDNFFIRAFELFGFSKEQF